MASNGKHSIETLHGWKFKLKKRSAIILSLVVIIVVVSAFVAVESFKPAAQVANKKPFYVGVTYGGNSTTEAEQLIDRVKNYTNLFVVQSGPLMDNGPALNQVCDYAVKSGLNIIVSFANGISRINVPSFLDDAHARWGSHFLGLYYNDEPGGKMLDYVVNLHINNETVTKQPMGGPLMVFSANSTGSSTKQFLPSGEIIIVSTSSTTNETVDTNNSVRVDSSVNTQYSPDDSITYQSSNTSSYPNGTWVSVYIGPITYEPNGTILNGNDQTVFTSYPNGTYVTKEHAQVVTDLGNISQFEPYQELWN